MILNTDLIFCIVNVHKIGTTQTGPRFLLVGESRLLKLNKISICSECQMKNNIQIKAKIYSKKKHVNQKRIILF
jgi:hypothetical protein